MSTLTHEASPTTYRDEPIALSPVLVNDLLLTDEPEVETVTTLCEINGRVYLLTTEEGGAILDERCLGSLDGDLYGVVPQSLWPMLDAWLDEDADGSRLRRLLRAAAMRERRWPALTAK